MPARAPLFQLLSRYRQHWLSPTVDETGPAWERAKVFADQVPTCCERSHLDRHFTGSALVVSPDFDQILLTHHAKLNKWLQLGGHADGEAALDQVAMREAEEESGLKGLKFAPCLIQHQAIIPFDMDIHTIPARRDEPEHDHYDMRFLIVAERDQPVTISEESHDLRWFSLADARAATDERSMHRQFEKLERLSHSFRN